MGIVETGAQRSKRDTPHKLGGLETMKAQARSGMSGEPLAVEVRD